MPHPAIMNRYTRRGWIVPTLKVLLLVALVVGGFAVGFLKLGPAWKNARQVAAVSDSTSQAGTPNADAGAGDSDKLAGSKSDADRQTTEPRTVEEETELASVHISEIPGPGGNVIPRVVPEGPVPHIPPEDEDAVETGEETSGEEEDQDTTGTVEDQSPEETRTPPSDSGTAGTAVVHRVVTGVFMERPNAEKMVANLRAKGFEASLRAVARGNQTLYTVQAGAYESHANALALKVRLEKAGFNPRIVTESQG